MIPTNGPQLIGEHAAFGGKQAFYGHESASCAGPMRFGIYLPPQASKGPVPVLYFLAGLSCTEETFAMKAGAQRVAAELGLAIVTPDTSPRATRYPGDAAAWDFGLGAGFYVDATRAPWSSSYRMFTYVTEELPALVEARFPVDATKVGILGHSMGGHGALVAALRAPERFRSVSALAPISSPTRCPWGEKALAGYLGDDRGAWHAYDACDLLETRGTAGTILVDQGTSDKFLATQLLPELLEKACARYRHALRSRRHEGYDHSYFFVATMIEEHLRHHAEELARAECLQLYYASEASQAMSDHELDVLLATARAKNERRGVTGMLLFSEGKFLQVLEGPPDVVRGLYARIATDPRHQACRVIWERRVSVREFPDWTMGFRRMNRQDLTAIPGYVDFFAQSPAASPWLVRLAFRG